MVNYSVIDVYLIKTEKHYMIKTSVSSICYFKQTFKNLLNTSKKKIYDEFRLNKYEIIYIESFKADNKQDKNNIEKLLKQKIKLLHKYKTEYD